MFIDLRISKPAGGKLASINLNPNSPIQKKHNFTNFVPHKVIKPSRHEELAKCKNEVEEWKRQIRSKCHSRAFSALPEALIENEHLLVCQRSKISPRKISYINSKLQDDMHLCLSENTRNTYQVSDKNVTNIHNLKSNQTFANVRNKKAKRVSQNAKKNEYLNLPVGSNVLQSQSITLNERVNGSSNMSCRLWGPENSSRKNSIIEHSVLEDRVPHQKFLRP